MSAMMDEEVKRHSARVTLRTRKIPHSRGIRSAFSRQDVLQRVVLKRQVGIYALQPGQLGLDVLQVP